MPLAPRTCVGPYEITAAIGAGGMSACGRTARERGGGVSSRGEPSAAAQPPTPGVAQFSVSGTGALVYLPGSTSPGSDTDLAFIDVEGRESPLNLPPRRYLSPRLSPDGTRVALATDDGKDARVWIHELAGTAAMRPLTLAGRNRFPIWTAQGDRVAFQAERDGRAGISWQRADGSGTPEPLTEAQPGEVHVPEAWAPDDRHFLFSVRKGADASLWVYSLETRKAEVVVRQSSTRPSASFSPDGQWIAYASEESGERNAFVEPFPTTGDKHQPSPGFPASFTAWSGDGRELYLYSSNVQGEFRVVSFASRPQVRFGSPVTRPAPSLFTAPPGGDGPWMFDIAKDGRILGVVRPETMSPEIRVVLNWFEELSQRVPAR